MRKRRKAVRLLSAAMLACVLAMGAAPLAFAEPDDENYTDEPTYEEPTYEEPTYEEPTYEEPTYEEPTTEEPTYEEPTYEEPTTEEPTYEEPTYPENYTPETTFEADWTYDNTWDQSYTLDQNNATSELSTDVSVDTSELTKSDWEELQRSLTQNTTPQGGSGNKDAKAFAEVKKNKDDGTSHNDVWIFLITGIPLIIVGVGLVAAVIILQVRNSRLQKAESTISLHTAPAPKRPPQNTAAPKTAAPKTAAPNAAPKAAKKKDLDETLSEPLDFGGKKGR